MKLIQRIKKIATSILPILVVFLSGAVWMQAVCLKEELEEVKSQTDYLIDGDAILQSQMSNVMQYLNIMHEGQDSLIEEKCIRLVDVNFKTGKYQVEILVIPREYSDITKVSVFFGVDEVPLTFKQYRYVGNAILSLEEDYDGNVTFLFADGDKKYTEIDPKYEDLNTRLEGMLWAEMMEEPEYQNGTIIFDSEIYYTLNQLEDYEYESFELVVSVGEEEEVVNEISSKSNEMFELTHHVKVEEGEEIRLFLRAKCENGLRFEYDLYRGVVEEKLVPLEKRYYIYDKDENLWK